MRALELFAGIGGLGIATADAVEVVAAYDQDHAAAEVHERTFGVPVMRIDLASVSARELLRHEADCWLVSPPCQPFTRRGVGRDVDDARCAGLLQLIALLPSCRPRAVLVENVHGFHGSRAHALLVSTLRSMGHDVADVEACPTQLGAPVRRPRQFVVSSADGLGPQASFAREPRPLTSYLARDPDPSLRVPENVRRRVDDHLPMPGPDGVLGTFTRSYGRAVTGAGPVLWDEHGPRYVSPDEILRLHDFPATFTFPEAMDRSTRWRLAGNSVHFGSVRHVATRLGACA